MAILPIVLLKSDNETKGAINAFVFDQDGNQSSRLAANVTPAITAHPIKQLEENRVAAPVYRLMASMLPVTYQ